MKTIYFRTSAGALLLAMGTACFLANLASPADLVTPHDPILALSMRTIFWIVGGVSLAVALDCLFDKNPTRPMLLLAWRAFNFLVYRIGLVAEEWRDLTGLLGGLAQTFGISAKTANILVHALWGYLMLGSGYMIWWLAKQRKLDENLLRMPCPGCGGHIQFANQNLGRKSTCPHCRMAITLRKPDLLKMTCFFCKQHIEFPPHAIGDKISCPHCKMDIRLKEPV
jgi:hypothetical protein